MADFGSPVAQDVNVNAGGGLDMLNKLLNARAAQQQLQTGAIQQQGLQAEVQQQQQTAKQRAAQASFFQDWDPTQHVGDDGTLDLNSAFSDKKLRAAAGDQFPDIAQKLIQVKQGQLVAKGQLAQLNTSLLDQMGKVVGGLREDPDVIAGNPAGYGKVANALSEVGAMGGPDAQRITGIFNNGLMQAPKKNGANGKSSLWNGVNALQLQAMDAATQAGKQAPSYSNVGGAQYNVSPQSGTGITPGMLKNTLPPGFNVITDQWGNQWAINPQTNQAMPLGHGMGGGRAPAAPEQPPQGGAGPATMLPPGQAKSTTDQIAAYSQRRDMAQVTANGSQGALDGLTRARAILDRGDISTGGGFEFMKDAKNALSGITGLDLSSATDANELVKNLARYEASRANSVGHTDTARSLVEAGSPNTHVDTQAAKNIITQSMATERATQAYANLLQTAPTPQEGMRREQAFRSIPHAIQAYELGLMRNPKEATEFYKRNGLSKADMDEAVAKLKQLGAL